MSKPPPAPILDDDVDDLDDVLHNFDTLAKAPPPAPPPTATTKTGFREPVFLNSPPPSASTSTAPTGFTGRPRTNTRVDKPPKSVPAVPGLPRNVDEEEVNEDALTAEFAKELAKGMEDLMKELADEQGTNGEDATETSKKAMKAWEDMLIQGMNGIVAEQEEEAGQQNSSSSGSGSGSATKGKDFQSTIKETMSRLRESESKFKNEESTRGSGTESFQELMSMLKDLDVGEGGETDEEMAALLENMMGQLMSKEILHEPLQELAEKFPPYLASPPNPLSQEQKQQYESQLACIRKILAIFDDPSYDESKPETVKTVVELMSEMQTFGTPPEEVMGPMPTGLPSDCVVT